MICRHAGSNLPDFHKARKLRMACPVLCSGPAHSGAFHSLLNQHPVASLDGTAADGQSLLLHFRVLHPLPVLSEELQNAEDGLAGRVRAGQPLRGADDAVDPLRPVAKGVPQGFEASVSFRRSFAIGAGNRRLEMLS